MSNVSKSGAGVSPPAARQHVRPTAQAPAPTAVVGQPDERRLVADLCRMIEIPSINPFDDEARPGFREREIGEFYLERMSELGLEVGHREVVPGRPNVWGVLKGRGEGPSVMLSGHLDTVGIDNYPDALKARVADGRIYGRGACDMKAGLAAYLEVARLLRESDLPLAGDLVITGLADEEHVMLGSKDLGRHGPWADYGIIGEPTDLVICPAHKGQLAYRIRTLGRAVHSSQPELGVNAIEAMARVVDAFGAYGGDLMTRDPHHLCGHARSCASVIRGGTIVSTVPDACELDVDRRTLPGETRDDIEAEYRRLLHGLAAAHPGFRYEIDGPFLDTPPLDIGEDSPVVRAVSDAYRAHGGEAGRVEAFFGATDAPNLGFPTLVFGPGALEQAHSLNEYVEIDDLVFCTRVYLSAVADLLTGQAER